VDRLELVVSKIDDLKSDMKDSHDEMKQDVSEIKASMVEIEIDLRKNTDDMRYHIKRTDLTDEVVELLRQEISLVKEKLTITYLAKLAVTAAAGIGTISGSIYGVIKLIDFLSK
jgi:SMC interacting uncharacterized protein involved in chromosome segregation